MAIRTLSAGLPGIHYGQGALAYNGYMYILGGFTSDVSTYSPVGTCKKARINTDGSLGNWSSFAPDFTARGGLTAFVASNGFMYVGPGQKASGYSAEFLTGRVQPNGDVARWVSISGPATLKGYQMWEHRGFLYFGGGTDGTPVSTIYRARLNGDGTLGKWTSVAAFPVTTVSNSNSVVIDDDFIVLAVGTSIYTARILGDGSFTAWVATLMGQTRTSSGVALFNNKLYVVGGWDLTTFTAKISSVALNSQRIPAGNLVDIDTISGPRENFDLVQDGNRFWVLGGVKSIGGISAIVQADADSGSTGTLKLKTISGAFVTATPLIGSAGGRATVNGTLSAAFLLDYVSQTHNFTAATTLTGGTSGATATITSDADAGATGTLTLASVVGNFVDGETLTDSKKYLAYVSQTGNFHAGVLLTGGTSGATATIASDADAGSTGTLTLTGVTGTFVDGEIITDTTTGSATTSGGVFSGTAVASKTQYKTLAYTSQTHNFAVGETVGAPGGAADIQYFVLGS